MNKPKPDYRHTLECAFTDIECRARRTMFKYAEDCNSELENSEFTKLATDIIGIVTRLDYLFYALSKYCVELENQFENLSK